MKLPIPKLQFTLVLFLATFLAGAVAMTHWALSPLLYFEVSMRSSAAGLAQTFYDAGRGFNELDSIRLPLSQAKSLAIYRFPLPEGEFRMIRFDPLEHGNAEIVISSARIVDMLGHTVRKFSPKELTVANGVSGSEIKNGELFLTLGPADNDSTLIINPGTPLTLRMALSARLLFAVRVFLLYFLPLAATGFLFLILVKRLWSTRMRQSYSQACAWIHCHPRATLLLMAVLGVGISCYPVVFFGKSFVSPNVAPMLYPGPPTVPGYNDTSWEVLKGSDTGAMMWQNLPYSFVQSRSIGQYAELPLWNRFHSSGTPLLGQGLSMFGDPLHTIVLAAGGAAWAWDVKFLLAKVLFCWALGLAVFGAGRHLPTALLLGPSAAFIGFFSYRFDHPAFFSMCYAPWLLLCWIEMTRARTARGTAGWAVALVFASWAELNSGAVKEAYMQLLSMHGCGVLLFLFGGGLKQRWKLLHISIMGIVFALMAAPIIFIFWHTLQNSFTAYQEGTGAWQIQPGMLIGLFDEIFYRGVNRNQEVYNPSLNFFVFLGCIYAMVHVRRLLRDKIFVAVGLSTLFSLALVFGVMPPSVIRLIPMVNHIWNVDNAFSCSLIIELVVVAGFGLRSHWQRIARRGWRWDYLLAILSFLVVLGAYVGFIQASQRGPNQFSPLGQGTMRGSFFYLYALSLIIAIWALPYLHRTAVVHSRFNTLVIPMVLLCLASLHWRQGLELKTGLAKIDDYVVNPTVRANLRERSEAVSFVKRQPGVWRTVGFDNTLFPGYNAIVGLESIYGTDPLINPYYRELLLSAGVKLDWTWRWIIEKANLRATMPLYSLLNVRYFFDWPAGGLESIAPLQKVASLDLNVHRNENAWPRAFFVDKVFRYDAVEQFIGMIPQEGGSPLAAIQLNDPVAFSATETLQARVEEPRRVVPARDFRLTNNTTTFVVDAPGPGVVVLTETYLGGESFDAKLNGESTEYFRVNHAFRGIRIPSAGTYTISFSYWPKHFTTTLIMFGAGLIVLTLWLGGTFFRRRERVASIA